MNGFPFIILLCVWIVILVMVIEDSRLEKRIEKLEHIVYAED